jgi:hypothetical protein
VTVLIVSQGETLTTKLKLQSRPFMCKEKSSTCLFATFGVAPPFAKVKQLNFDMMNRKKIVCISYTTGYLII